MKDLTHLSLFSGIGGLDLAAEWAGFQTVGQCEWADYPIKVLEKHWPNVPRWRDIRTLTGESFYERTGLHTVDVISGGFPCQPFSVAGKRRGKEDDRYLWPEMVRVIKELRPTWVIGENVAGIVKMALPDILSELEACGYRTRTFLVPACAVGARHRRYRVAIVAWDTNGRDGDKRPEQSVEKRKNSESTGICSGAPETSKNVAYTKGKGERGLPVQQGRPQQEDNDTERTGKTLADIESERLPDGTSQQMGGYGTPQQEPERSGSKTGEWTAQPGLGGVVNGFPDWVDRYWDIEPDIPRLAVGAKNRVGRLKALGNAVVPQQFYPFFKAIAKTTEINGMEESVWRD